MVTGSTLTERNAHCKKFSASRTKFTQMGESTLDISDKNAQLDNKNQERYRTYTWNKLLGVGDNFQEVNSKLLVNSRSIKPLVGHRVRLNRLDISLNDLQEVIFWLLP